MGTGPNSPSKFLTALHKNVILCMTFMGLDCRYQSLNGTKEMFFISNSAMELSQRKPKKSLLIDLSSERQKRDIM